MSRLSEQLTELPAHEPPAGGWQALQQRRWRERRRSQALGAGFAIAASVLLTFGMLVWQSPQDAGDAAQPVELVQLKARSRQLEVALAQARPQALRWSPQLAGAASSLQDKLTVVDLQLNYADAAGAERLWQNRVELMARLLQTHEAAATGAQTVQRDNEEYAI